MSTPMRRIPSDCCARVAIGQTTAPPSTPMNVRRLIAAPEAQTGHRTGSNYPIERPPHDVRFGPQADSCKAAKWLFDQLVGERKQVRRYIEPERFGGCHVDDEIDLCCQLNRHIGGCRPFENAASVDAGTTIGIGLA